MTTLELIPVVLALCLWGVRLANKRVLFHIDNQALVTIYNKQTSKSQRVMFLIRPFIIDCMLLNICFRAVHIPTKNNIIADSISRQQWQRFRQAAPQAQIKPVPVPNSFQHLISNMRKTDFFMLHSLKIHIEHTRLVLIHTIIFVHNMAIIVFGHHL